MFNAATPTGLRPAAVRPPKAGSGSVQSRGSTGMGDVIPFHKPKRFATQGDKALCRSGRHDWEIVHAQRFDVKRGRLVTVSRCRRCNAIKNETL